GVDGARDELLAGAALARNEHAAFRGGGHLDELVDAPHGLGPADHAVPRSVGDLLEVRLPPGQRGMEYTVEDLEEAVPRDRLLEEIGRADLHGLDGLGHAAVPRDDDDGRARRLSLELAQHVDAGSVRQPQVQEHGRRPVLGEETQALAHRRGGKGLVAAGLQQLHAGLPDHVVFFGSWMQAGEEFFLKKEPGRFVWRGTAPRVPVNFPPRGEPYLVRVYDPHIVGGPTEGITADRLKVGGEALSRFFSPGN